MFALASALNLENPKKEFILIQYPGIIKNTENALKTLGGLSTIGQSHFNGKNLELRHTPDNPYTSCLTADKKTDSTVTSGTLRLVIKIRRHKKNKDLIKTECLGLVNYVYNFESMCDFQYVPLRRNAADKYTDLIPSLIPTTLEASLSWWENQDDDPEKTNLFLPPYQFSRYTTPSTKILCRETDFSVEKMKRKTGHGQNLRTERKALSVTVHAEDIFPEAPTQDAIDDANYRCKNAEPHRLLTNLFEERPMWTRVAITFKTGLDEQVLKSILQKYAFYIQSGPWGRLWCKFGYDPRTEPEAKNYQSIMVSFRQHTKIPERQRLKVSMDRSGIRPDLKTPINYTYTPGLLPKVRQMWYSICDIHLTFASNILATDYSNATDVAKNGWINSEVLKTLRSCIKEDVERIAEEMDIQEDENFDINDDF